MKNYIPSSIFRRLVTDKKFRVEVTKRNLLYFFCFYLSDYITNEMADFQREILALLQNENNKTVVITAFRNSAKSTFCSLLLPIWSIVGIHRKKNVLIVCRTEQKAQQTLSNIRTLLETHELLCADHGAFYNGNDEWNRQTLVIPKYDARITVVSIPESIRGIRHKQYRPDLMVFDDIEDVQSAKTQESRDKTWETIMAEFMPAGSIDTRYVFIGNLVHMDSVMVRLRNLIQNGKMSGIYRSYPLLDQDNHILWQGMYPDMAAVSSLKHQQPSEIDFLREYMLKILPDGSQIIHFDDIHRYTEDDLRPRADFQMYLISIDPAVSKATTADYTAIIVFKIYGSGETLKICIMPHPINRRMELPEIIAEVKRILLSLGPNPVYKILAEGGSTQQGITQLLQYIGLNALDITPQGNDKRTRVSIAKNWIEKTIFFPESGTEELELQLCGFETEKHDDLVDALTLATLALPDITKQLTNNVFAVKSNWGEYLNRLTNLAADDDDDFDCDAFFGNKTKHEWTRIM